MFMREKRRRRIPGRYGEDAEKKMEKPRYVASLIEGRARLRHPVFATDEGLAKAEDVLSRHKQIRDVERGNRSLLVFFEPTLKFDALCRELEEAIPALAPKKEDATPKRLLEMLFGVSMRKIEVRCLFGTMLFTALMGFVGSGKVHQYAAIGCLGLIMRHLWVRRKAI